MVIWGRCCQHAQRASTRVVWVAGDPTSEMDEGGRLWPAPKNDVQIVSTTGRWAKILDLRLRGIPDVAFYSS